MRLAGAFFPEGSLEDEICSPIDSIVADPLFCGCGASLSAPDTVVRFYSSSPAGGQPQKNLRSRAKPRRTTKWRGW